MMYAREREGAKPPRSVPPAQHHGEVETNGGWTCQPYSVGAAIEVADALGVSPATAAVLARRGLGDPAGARRFLSAADRSDPSTLPGADAAAAVILRHAEAGSRVAVFGDYDVDGVCSTAMMVRTLRALGADAIWRLPSRDEGYGLSESAVRELAGAGAGLLVTVDCGITAVDEVAAARGLGLEVVVTDHHRPAERLPDCPIVHPGLGAEPSSELCAAGVVLKLSQALRRAAGRGDAEEDLDLAGLATVCDMVPLRGENRRIAREGLAELARSERPGLRALMRVAALDAADVDAQSASFRLGPRINAAGRLGRADAALELMLTDDGERATQVAQELDNLNRDRRETEQRILFAADAACAAQLHSAALVVAGEGWHPGVVGIVASRLVERHRRPCVVIGLEGGSGRGSGRSVASYDLHEGLGSAAGHLLRFGGHRMAAGLTIEEGVGGPLPPGARGSRGRTAVSVRPRARARGRRRGVRRGAVARPRRGARAPRSLRGGQPGAVPARAGGEDRARHRDGRGAGPRALQPRRRRDARPRGGLPDLPAGPRRHRSRPSRRRGEPRAQPMERHGGGPGGAALALPDPGGRRARAGGRGLLDGPRARARRRPGSVVARGRPIRIPGDARPPRGGPRRAWRGR